MQQFGEIKYLNLRDIWNNEASNFTPWLAEHIQSLGKSLGLDLEINQREAPVGDFSLDLLAKDLASNKIVIIENQLTQTDHDHLGKLLTYASGYDASVIIWIAESIRDEHRKTLEWLNNITDENTYFFGVAIEILQIDDSKPAYNFKVIVSPNEWAKSKKSISTAQSSEKMEKYRDYFQTLIDELRTEHKFTNAKKGQPQSWYSFSTGINGLLFGMCFALGGKVRIECYIDFGETEKNKDFFDALVSKKDEIEKKYGEVFTWERLDEKRASRVALYRDGSIEDDMNNSIELEKKIECGAKILMLKLPCWVIKG
ncbi:DUF4268 domain-containing protein [Spirochaetota bacterium]